MVYVCECQKIQSNRHKFLFYKFVESRHSSCLVYRIISVTMILLPLITFKLPEHTGVFLCFLNLCPPQWQRICVFLRWDQNDHFMDDCWHFVRWQNWETYADSVKVYMQNEIQRCEDSTESMVMFSSDTDNYRITGSEYQYGGRWYTLTRYISMKYFWDNIVLLEKVPVVQLAKKLPAFYRTRRFTDILTRPRKISPSLSQNSVHILISYSFMIHVSIILLSMPRSVLWSLPSRFSD
jgi:hypothetical protein